MVEDHQLEAARRLLDQAKDALDRP
jgi:hypothetical protein